MIRRLVPWLRSVVLGGIACWLTAGLAQTSPGQTAPAALSDRAYIASVVGVDAQVPKSALSSETLGTRRRGSGIVIGDQLVLTIGYLLLEADQVTVTLNSGRKVPAAVAGYDHSSGLGLIRAALPLSVPAVDFGDSDAIADRQRLLTIGFGEAQATELVVISRKVFAGSWEYLLERPIFTFPPVSNWSGSALFTDDGRLLGVGSLVVNDAAAVERGVPGNLFVPINLLKPILRDLVDKGRRSQAITPWLGMSTELIAGKLTVTRTSRDGPADLAGIEPGDVVVAVGADPVSDLADFYRRVRGRGAAGVAVPLEILKAGSSRQFTLKSIDRSDFIAKPGGV